MRRSPVSRRQMLAFLLIVLTPGCGTEAPPGSATPTDAPATPGAAPSTWDATGPGRLTVTLQEGTNLSFALRPDGETLVLSVQGVLFSVPVAGGEARPLTSYVHDAREPVWTPDGSKLVFQGYRNGTWDLFSLPFSSEARPNPDPLPLTTDPFDDREPAVSPTGTHVAFASDRSGNYDIWLLKLADGSLTRVTDTPFDEAAPSFSPDGSRIAYTASPTRGTSELKEIELATGTVTTLASEQGLIGGSTWHPGGSSLVYQLTQPGQTVLKTMSRPGGAVSPISQPDDDVFPFRAAWLDDETVLYAANGVVYRQSVDGSRTPIPFRADVVLERPAYERRKRDYDDVRERKALGLARPVISPDGSRIAFSALGDLWLWEPGSETLVNLTDNPFADHSPQFSPSGNRIAYVSDRPVDDATTGGSRLWIHDLSGGAHTPVRLEADNVSNLAWSPDGDTVALFVSVPGNPLGAQLTVVDLDDGSTTPLLSPMPPQPVSWSSDGDFVATTALTPYAARYREGTYRLAVASPTTGQRHQIEPVAHKTISDVALGPYGQFVSYVQDGQLWQLNLTEDFRPSGYPEALTAQLTDSPSWSMGGRYVVFMNGDRMLRLNVETGATDDVTPAVPWRPARTNARWTLKIGRLFDGTGDGYHENVLLAIAGNRIERVTPEATDVEADLDLSGLTAFPGLFEMHAHMGELSESQGRAWLAYGVTSVRDPGAHPYVAKERQEYWDSGRAPGPRTHVTGYLLDGNRVYYSVAEGIGSDIHLERALERAQKLGLDFIKTYVRLPDHRQKRVVEFAHGLGIPVSSHELFPAVAQGVDHVEHIGGTSRRGYTPKVSSLGRSYDDVVQLLTASGMGITPTAVLPGYAVVARENPDLFDSPQFQAFYGDAGRAAASTVSSMFGAGVDEIVEGNARLLETLIGTGALVVTGTDSPFVPYGAGLHAELRLYARAGIKPADILRMASVQSARAAGVEADIGRIAPGMIADLVVVDGDPLTSIADADNVVLTIKNGRVFRLETLLSGS